VSYLVAAMLAWVPVYAHAPIESSEHALERYQDIARDLASVVLDESESPLFNGSGGRSETALLMLSVASFESSFSKRVDDGNRRGDRGLSYCLMQIHVGNGVTREGWNGQQLIEDRKLCFRAGLHILQNSFSACRNLTVDDRLSAYATGHCYPEARISRSRVGRARAWWESHTPPPDATTRS
jgi:hypothetical protein